MRIIRRKTSNRFLFFLVGLIHITYNSFIYSSFTHKKQKNIIVKVGICGDYPPFEYIDPKGEIIGKNREVLEKLVKILTANYPKYNLTLKYQIVNFEEGFYLLEKGSLDILAASVSPNKEREKNFQFLSPIFLTEMCVVQHSEKSEVLAVQIGSLQEEYAIKNLPHKLVRVGTIVDMLFLYKSYRVDGIIINTHAYEFFRQNAAIDGQVIKLPVKEIIAFAMRKTPSKLNDFDKYITKKLIILFKEYNQQLTRDN